MVYDINGLSAEPKYNGFEYVMNYTYQRESEYGIFYTVITIPQSTPDGNKQYPFVYYPNYPNARSESAIELNRRKNFLLVLSGGQFDVSSGLPNGTVIQDSTNCTVRQSSDSWLRTLTIDSNGVLGYASPDTSPATLIGNGIVSAFTGFFPLIANFKNIEDVDNTIAVSTSREEIAQRIAICQYDNGDYMVIATEGRGNRSGSGNTGETLSFKEFQQLIKKYGVKFAFAFDGGGSTSMILGQQSLLPLYDAPNGRHLPVFLVFNGSTEFPG